MQRNQIGVEMDMDMETEMDMCYVRRELFLARFLGDLHYVNS